MLALHRRANPDEVVVGWYATSSDGVFVNNESIMIHEYYSQDVAAPVHLVLDTSLKGDSLELKVYSAVSVGESPLAAEFRQIRAEMVVSEPEQIGLDLMVKAAVNNTTTTPTVGREMIVLESSIERLLTLLETASSYIDSVVEGRAPPDYKTGRQVADLVSMVPRIKHDVFARAFNNNLHDLLMVVYLSNFTKAHLAIAERLRVALA